MKIFLKQRAFTLVELLVVVAIIAILVLIAVPRYAFSINGAKLKTFESNMRVVASEVVSLQAEHNGTLDSIGQSSLKEYLKNSLDDKPSSAVYNYDSTSDIVTGTCNIAGQTLNIIYDIHNSTIEYAKGTPIDSNGQFTTPLLKNLSVSFPVKK